MSPKHGSTLLGIDLNGASPALGDSMSARIRHCLQCPKCLTRYLVSASPYGDGSYLVHTTLHAVDEYLLYCACQTPAAVSRFRCGDLHRCEVTKDAHRRGFGSPEEIVAIRRDDSSSWSFDIEKYVNQHSIQKVRSPHEY